MQCTSAILSTDGVVLFLDCSKTFPKVLSNLSHTWAKPLTFIRPPHPHPHLPRVTLLLPPLSCRVIFSFPSMHNQSNCTRLKLRFASIRRLPHFTAGDEVRVLMVSPAFSSVHCEPHQAFRCRTNYAMEALNAAGLIPISVLCDRKREPRKVLSLPTNSPLKLSNSSSSSNTSPKSREPASWGFHGGLVLASSLINTGLAKGLTYEEALQQSLSALAPEGGLDFDARGVLDNVISFATENPAVIVGGAVILALPLVLSQIFKPPRPFGVDSARNAYAKLRDDASAQLLDIRTPVEFRQVGSPDVRGLGKKPVSIVYRGDEKPGFLKKLSLKFKEPENITLFILDKFDGNSGLVAELVTVNGFKAAYAIKDGAEGPRGWMNSNLPWMPPKRALSLDLSNLTEAISGDGSDGLSVALGVAAATGLGLLAFSEVETILQLLGSAAIVQFVSKKLLFAEDRKETLQQVDEFLSTKVAPKELVDEIKQIGKALLPTTASSKALPAPEETSSEPASTNNTIQKIETPAAPIPEPKVEAAAKPPIEVNSVPKEEVKAESLSGFVRALSPYPYYPDFKPPTSPTPSQP